MWHAPANQHWAERMSGGQIFPEWNRGNPVTTKTVMGYEERVEKQADSNQSGNITTATWNIRAWMWRSTSEKIVEAYFQEQKMRNAVERWTQVPRDVSWRSNQTVSLLTNKTKSEEGRYRSLLYAQLTFLVPYESLLSQWAFVDEHCALQRASRPLVRLLEAK